MAKPEDIPQDVWDRAHDASLLLVATAETNVETIACAILSAVEEEREACAIEADAIAVGRDRQALDAKDHREKAAARDFESMAISAGDVARAIRNRNGA